MERGERGFLRRSFPLTRGTLCPFLNKVGRTEALKDAKNPDFSRSIEIDYRFEEIQEIRFRVYDVDDSNAAMNELIGEFHTRVSLIINTPTAELQGVRWPAPPPPCIAHPHGVAQALSLPAEPKKKQKRRGMLVVRAEEVAVVRGTVRLHLFGHDLDKKDTFGKVRLGRLVGRRAGVHSFCCLTQQSDPYVIMSRPSDAGVMTVFHKTEIIKKTLDPTFKPFEVSLSAFCNGDYDRPIEFKVIDWDYEGSHDLIGVFQATLKELLDPDHGSFPVRGPRMVKVLCFVLVGSCRLRSLYALDARSSTQKRRRRRRTTTTRATSRCSAPSLNRRRFSTTCAAA